MGAQAPPQNVRKILCLAAFAGGVLAVALGPGKSLPAEKVAPFQETHAPLAARSFQKTPALIRAAASAAPAGRESASPVQTPPLPAGFAAFSILAQDRQQLPATGETERRRIVRSTFKFPFLRIRSVLRGEAIVAEEAVVADQLLVTLQPGISAAALAAALAESGIRIRENLPGSDTLLLQLPAHELDSVDRAQSLLKSRADLFLHVDPNGVGFGAAPNDPRFAAQWALQNTGQNGGSVGADVNATGLWSIVASAPKVLVAILDSGMDFTHQDLAGIAWKNPGEIPGNGIDDDGNGRIDDVNGWDFVNSDNDPTDDHDHGSHVTGILAARRGNGLGIAGLAAPVAILPVKILNSTNAGFTSDLIAALDYARLLGARVMNLSLQNFPTSGSFQSAMDRTEAAGIVVCACAGNQGVNNDAFPNYPSSFTNANVIAVGNHDRTDVRWNGSTPSNYGLASVDLFAPGREIVSTVRGSLYSAFTGTSMSCPHVAAVAAIIRALNPEWMPADVKSCILNTVTTRPAYGGICVSGGRLNAGAAINRAIKLQPTNDPDGDGTPSLVEYSLGTDPLLSGVNSATAFQINGLTLEFTYPRPRADISYAVEASDDFIAWDSGIVNQGGAGTPATATVPVGIAGHRFLRLRVSLLP